MNTLRFARAPHALALLLTVVGLVWTAPAAAQSDFSTLVPACRQYDSRGGGGTFDQGSTHDATLTGAPCGVPTDATTVALEVTIIAPSRGELIVYPTGTTPPSGSPPPGAISFTNGLTTAQVYVQLGTGGQVSFKASYASAGKYHVAIDVEAYFQNQPSTVGNDSATVLEDAAATPIDVLANDSDPDDTLSIASASNPANGTVVLTPVGPGPYTGLTYQPDADYCNDPPGTTPDTFTYTLNTGSIGTVEVLVTCVNDAPAGTDKAVTTGEDTDYVFTTADFGFTDPNDSPANSLLAVTITTLPDKGTLKLSNVAVTMGQSIAVADITGGNLTFTPAAGANGVPYTSFTFQVQDDGGTANSGVDLDATPNTITMNVSDVNDPPAPSGGPFSLAENSAVGTVVGTVAANDPDPGQTHTFAITAGNTGGAFAINNSGVITVANQAALDFETTPTFSLTVQATDNGSPVLSGSGTVVVNLTNGNEPPAPTGGPFSVPENSAVNTVVGTVLPNDPDSGQSHTFAITAGNTGGAFSIDGAGVIKVATPAALDFETTPTFSLTVQVTDNGTPVQSGSTTVVVNLTDANDAPAPSGGPFSVPENSANGTTVGTVTVTDQDAGQTHTFAITAGNTGGAFAIDGSGVITVASSAALNFETTPTFNLTVQVTDNGTPVLSGSTTVVVNLADVNEPPVPSGGPFSLAENSANGTTVGTVAHGDPDGGQSHTFSITAGNTGGAFAINGSGVITVANSAALNFETTPTFNLTVQVTDNGTPILSGSTTVVVNLTDVNEAPAPSGGPFSLAENSANGTTVGTVLAGDQDSGQSYTFSITAGNTGGAFAINSSGVITVANSAALNFETTPTFNLTVQVTDNGTPVLSGSTTVVVNLTDVNEAPVPSGGPCSLPENSANGTTVCTVLAGDQDSGQSHTFSITAGNTGGAFAINGSGVITVATTAALDFETNPTFNLTVQVTDNGTPVLSGSTTVVVNLTNVNEPPVPSGGPFTIPENSANGTSVGTVSATDPDAGQSHTFSITAGNTGGAFAINSSGLITVANVTAVNFEATPVFNLTVQVTDNGTPVLSGSTTVTINLLNVPEAPIAGDEGTLASPYVETAGNTLLEVKAALSPLTEPKVAFIGNILTNDTDPDGPTTFNITLESATAGAVVALHSSDGTFTYVPPPGFTGVDSFTYRITDPNSLFDTGTVYINVKHRVWYVKNNTGTAGTAGTTADPFNTLAKAELASAANDTIYVFEGTGSTVGQSDGITLKNGQRLLGEAVQLTVPSTVTINGTAGLTLRTTTGNRPKIENDNTPDAAGEDNGVSVPATAGSLAGVEIRGLDIQGFDNAIDVTATGANNADVTIANVTVSGTGLEGIDVNAGSTGTTTISVSNADLTSTGNAFDARTSAAGNLRINFSNNANILSNATGVLIDGSFASSSTTITGFSSNSVHGNTAGTGISINGATFDGTPGAPFNTILANATAVGASGNGVGGLGMVFTNVQGDLSFTNLNIFAEGGAGLRASSTTAYTGSAGLRLVISSPSVAIIEATGGPAVDITTATIDLQLSSLKSTNTPTTGVSLVSVSDGGTTNAVFSAGSGSSITTTAGASGPAFNVSGGNAKITYGGTITNNGTGRAVSITTWSGDDAVPGDDFLLSGAIDENGVGILVNGNGGSRAITFSGGLDIDTTSGEGFAATSNTNALGLHITGSANDLTSTSATALRVSSTTIGSSNLNFRNVSSGNNTAAADPANGIVLNATGTLGRLIITGTGASGQGGNGSGGLIQNITSHGISLTDTMNPSFTNMSIQSTGGSGINGTLVAGFTFDNGTINNSGTAGGTDDSNISFNDSSTNANASGTVTVTDSVLTNSRFHGVDIQHYSGTIAHADIQNNAFTSAASIATSLGSAIRLDAYGTAATVGHVTRATINNNVITNFPTGAGIHAFGGNSGGSGPAGTFGVAGSGTDIIAITNNLMNGGSLGVGNQPDRFFTGGVTGSGQGNFNISGNGTAASPITNIDGVVIELNQFGTGSMTATVNNNRIVANNAVGSAGINVGCDADGTAALDNAVVSATISGNNVSDTDGPGIFAIARGSDCNLTARILSNTVAAPDTTTAARAGIRVDSGSAAGDTTLCLEISGNTTAGSTNTATSTTSPGINLRKQGTSTAVNIFGIEGLSPSPTGTPNVENHVNGLNTSTSGTFGVNGTALLSATSGFTSCVAP
jgi:hypothetical protein